MDADAQQTLSATGTFEVPRENEGALMVGLKILAAMRQVSSGAYFQFTPAGNMSAVTILCSERIDPTRLARDVLALQLSLVAEDFKRDETEAIEHELALEAATHPRMAVAA